MPFFTPSVEVELVGEPGREVYRSSGIYLTTRSQHLTLTTFPHIRCVSIWGDTLISQIVNKLPCEQIWSRYAGPRVGQMAQLEVAVEGLWDGLSKKKKFKQQQMITILFVMNVLSCTIGIGWDVKLYCGWNLLGKVHSRLVQEHVASRVFPLDLNTGGRLQHCQLHRFIVPNWLFRYNYGLDVFLLTQFDVDDSFYVSGNICPFQLKWPPTQCRLPLQCLCMYLEQDKKPRRFYPSQFCFQ